MKFATFAPASAANIKKFNFSKNLTIDQNVWSGFVVDDIMTKKIEKSQISIEKLFHPVPEIIKKIQLTKLEKQKEKKKFNKKYQKIIRQ